MFYQSQDDLINLLAEYFKPGIENGERGIWVTSGGSVEEKARNILNQKLASSGKKQDCSQIEFIRYSDWYLQDGTFRPQQVLKSWIDRTEMALNQGYRGLRVTGDLCWLDATDWQTLMGYESDVNGLITGMNLMAICSYPLEKLHASRMLDVISRHQVGLGKNNGQWHTFKNVPPIKTPVPSKPDEAIPGKQAHGISTPGFPVLYPENCTGCGDCVSVCSTGNLYLDEGRIALKMVGECDWCTYCEAVCLTQAILCPFEIELV